MKDPPANDARVVASPGTDGGLLFPSGNGFIQLLIKRFGAAGGTGDRCQVTLRRFGVPGAADWTGDAAGNPQLFPLQTVDVLVADKAIWVFDKSNKRLWESKLNSELLGGFRPALAGETPPFGEGPVVEKGDTLYLFDAAELTAFDLASGNARWHLATPSIAGLHFDAQGIYVNSSGQSPGILKGQSHADVPESVPHMVQKVEAKTGRVVWSADREGLVRYLSGKFLYTVASQHGDTAEDEDFDLPVLNTGMQKTPHVRIKRLDPSTGKVIWEHYHRHSPLDVRFEKNTISVLCRKEMQVLKYLAF
jgi:outer membrane protein assembly factor BamB